MATGVFRPDTADAAARTRAAQARAGVIPVAGPPQPGRRAANVVGQAPVAPIAYRPVLGPTYTPTFSRTGPSADALEGAALARSRAAGVPDLSSITADQWAALGRLGGQTGTGTGGDGGSTGGSTGGTPNIPTVPQQDIFGDLLNEFGRIRASEEAKIREAGANLATALGQIDPMAAYRWNPATITIPEAATVRYLQSIGASPEQAQAVQQLGQELMGASQADIGQYAAGVQQAITNQRLAQQAVGQTMTADALNRLALESMAAQMGIKSAQAAESKADRDLALKLALEYGKMNPSGTVTAPQIPLTSVTLPNGQVIQIPSNYFQS